MQDKLKTVLLVCALLLVVFTVGATKTAANSAFCGTVCHEMAPEYYTWQVSAHANMSCTTCHSKPEKVSLIDYKLSAAKVIAAHFSDSFPRPITMKKEIPDQICDQCHTNKRNSTPSGDLLIPHDKHKAKGISCSTCHSGVAHGIIAERGITKDGNFDVWNVSKGEENTKPHFAQPKMKVCMDCHTERKITTDCKACHTVLTLPDTHTVPSWGTSHGMSARTDFKVCANCHSDEKFTPQSGIDIGAQYAQNTQFCYSCHNKRPPSHTKEWLGMHKSKVTEKGQQNCVVCHSLAKPKEPNNYAPTFCNKCHWFSNFDNL